MNRGKIFWGVLCLSGALVAAPALFAEFNYAMSFAPALIAQVGHAAGIPMQFGPMGRRGFGSRPITGAPYSATRTITHVQTLANGTTITHTTVINESRDSSGRMYTASTSNGSTSNGSSFTSYRIFDPVSRQSISWNSNSKVANVMHLPDPSQFKGRGQGAGGQGAEGQSAGGQGPGPQGAQGFHRNGVQPNVQNLGTTSIAGVNAEGTLTTRTIPAGKDGNSAPLVSSHESWLSSDLKIELKRVDTDPRDGTTTDEVSNLNQGEPDASLFQVPNGYTVRDQPNRGHRPQFAPPPPAGQ